MADAPRQKWSLTQQAFDGFLASLGPDRDAAGDRYLEIRGNLVRLFEWRGCPTPEDYADETINRCARKIADGDVIRDVASYCIGIARMLVLEMSRDRSKDAWSLDQVQEPQVAPADPENDPERGVECLRQCLALLPPENRELILSYYQGDKGEKINKRKGLKDYFGIPGSTLRMRALRLREKLQVCAQNCLQQEAILL